MRVLITGVGFGSVGEAIANAIDKSEHTVFHCDADKSAPLLYDSDLEGSFIVPEATSELYIPNILGISIIHDIDLIIPGTEIELLTLSMSRQIFNKHDTLILANNHNLIETAMDKYQIMKILLDNGFSVPFTALGSEFSEINGSTEVLSNKIIYKPRFGHGARGIGVCEIDDIPRFVFTDDYVIQSYLEGKEYTSALISDLNDVKCVYGVFVAEHRIISGAPWLIKPFHDDKLKNELRNIAITLGSTGPLNVQFKLIDNRPVIFEINARLSGSVAMRRMLGFDDLEFLLQQYQRLKDSQTSLNQGLLRSDIDKTAAAQFTFTTFDREGVRDGSK